MGQRWIDRYGPLEWPYGSEPDPDPEPAEPVFGENPLPYGHPGRGTR